MSGKYHAIVIGGSSGSIDSIINLLTDLPKTFNIPVIIVIHRMRNAESKLENIFKFKSSIKKIKEADDKEPILTGNIYIAPPNYHLILEENKTLSLDYSELVNYSRPSIDVTFESAALAYKENLIGILLSGSNSDGSEGLKKIKYYNGLTIVQDPKEAKSPIMPMSAIKSLKVDHIMTIKEIQTFLISLNNEQTN